MPIRNRIFGCIIVLMQYRSTLLIKLMRALVQQKLIKHTK